MSVNQIENKLMNYLQILVKSNGNKNIEIDTSFSIAENLDSMQIIQFVDFVYREYGVTYGDRYTDISALESIKNFSEWIVSSK